MHQRDTSSRRAGARSAWSWTKSKPARRLFSWSRWLHVYLSTALLALLIFFSITGLFLNHLDWFAHKGAYQEHEYPLPSHFSTAWRGDAQPPLLEMEAWLNTEYGLSDPRKIDIDLEFGEVAFDFPLPAGYAMATFQQETQTLLLEHQEGTLIAVLNDLHKGRHTGDSWSWVIDISAVLMILMSLTGMVILFQQAKWRMHGVVLMLLGTLLPWVIYLLWVPKLN